MTVSSQIIEVINDLCAKFGMIVDWSAENVMPQLQNLMAKYISWEIATSWVWIWIGVFLVVLGIVFFVLDCVNYGEGMLIFFGSVLVIVALITIVCQIFDIVECKVFPEKAVFEYVQYLLRSR